MEKENTKYNYNIKEMQVGDIALCQIELGHVIVEYELVVTCINPNDFEEDEEGVLRVVAFGEGYTDEDKEFIEEEATCRIDESNFIYFYREEQKEK